MKHDEPFAWRKKSPYGFKQETWDAAKNQAYRAMAQHCRDAKVITYGQLAAAVTEIRFSGGHDPNLWRLIGEISVDEAAAQRGAISAIVVNQDGRPGQGFFDVLKDLGRDVSDKEECWAAEVKLVHASWKDLGRHAALPTAPGGPFQSA